MGCCKSPWSQSCILVWSSLSILVLVRIVKGFKSKSLVYIIKCEPTCCISSLTVLLITLISLIISQSFFCGWCRGNLPLPPCCCGLWSHVSPTFCMFLRHPALLTSISKWDWTWGMPRGSSPPLCAESSISACPSGGTWPQDTVLPPETLLWPPVNMLRHQIYFSTVNSRCYHVLIIT